MKKFKSCTRSLYHISFCFLLIFCTNQESVDNRGGKESSLQPQKLLLKNKKVLLHWYTVNDPDLWHKPDMSCLYLSLYRQRYTSCRILEIYTIWHERLITYQTNVGWRMPQKQMNAQIVLFKHINRIPHTMCQSLHRIIYNFPDL